MPFGLKSQGAVKSLIEATSQIGFTFTNELILPPEQMSVLKSVYMRNASQKRDEQSKEEQEQMDRLIKQIIDKLQECGGKIHPFVGSEGGTGKSKQENGKKSRTEYVVMHVNNVIILEPIGQENNATFIARADKKDLVKEIIALNRNSTVTRGILSRVFHQRTNAGKYDYSSGHVIELLDYASRFPDELLNVLENLMKTQQSCSLATVSQRMPNTVNDVVDNIAQQIQNRNISAQSVIGAGNELNGNENELNGTDNELTHIVE